MVQIDKGSRKKTTQQPSANMLVEEPEPAAKSLVDLIPSPAAASALTISSCSTMSTSSSYASTSATNLSGASSNHVSERVSQMASAIYKELESVIHAHGEDSFRVLTALIISVLELLDAAWQDKQQFETDIELLKEDREQLLTQWQRATQMKQIAEQKCIQFEDYQEEQKSQYEERIAKIISKLRISELKLKNANEQVARFEEKDTESKRNYAKLREKYREIFRQHYEHMNGIGSFRQTQFSESPVSLVTTTTSVNSGSGSTKLPKGFTSEIDEAEVDKCVREKKDKAKRTDEQSRLTLQFDDACCYDCEKVIVSRPSFLVHKTRTNNVHLSEFERSECTKTGSDEETEFRFEDGLSSTGGDSVDTSMQQCLFGMTKEVDKLILENSELIETKNALNILKNDLIQRIEELTTQLEISREEWATASAEKQKLKDKNAELEKEVNVFKNDAHMDRLANDDDVADDGSCDKRFFTREEMCKVLNEKNKYKRMYMDLEDAIKFENSLRYASEQQIECEQPKGKRSRIWQFFSTLLTGTSMSSSSLLNVDAVGKSPKTISHSSSAQSLQCSTRQPRQRINSGERTGSIRSIHEHDSKFATIDIGERSLVNHWFSPTANTTSQKLPIYCSRLDLEKNCFGGIERFYTADSFSENEQNHWWIVAKRKKFASSQVIVLAATSENNELLKAQKTFSLHDQLIVACFCFVPGTTNVAADSFDGGCEFCRREKDLNGADKCSVWLGGQHGILSIYDATSAELLASMKLKHSIMSIIYHQNRVYFGLSNGELIITHRDSKGGWLSEYDSSSFHCISLSDNGRNSVRSLCAVSQDQCWCGIRNQVYVLDRTLTVLARFDVRARTSSQIRQICTTYDANYENHQHAPLAFISARYDSSVIVYDVYNRNAIQDIDVDPLERSVLGNSDVNESGLMLVKIAYIHVIKNQLWVGTSNGNIICLNISTDRIPFKNTINSSTNNNKSNGIFRVNTIKKALISAECHMGEVELISSGKVYIPGKSGKEGKWAVIVCGIGSKTLAPSSNNQQCTPSIKELCTANSEAFMWLID